MFGLPPLVLSCLYVFQYDSIHIRATLPLLAPSRNDPLGSTEIAKCGSNKTTKQRRSRVIGIFPNESSILRLMGSVLIEQHEALSLGRAVFSKETLENLMRF